MLELIAGETPGEGSGFKRTIRKIVAERASHSLFVGLVHADSNRMSSISEDSVDSSIGNNDNDFSVRSLLHLTPLKDIKVSRSKVIFMLIFYQHVASMYVAVVG